MSQEAALSCNPHGDPPIAISWQTASSTIHSKADRSALYHTKQGRQVSNIIHSKADRSALQYKARQTGQLYHTHYTARQTGQLYHTHYTARHTGQLYHTQKGIQVSSTIHRKADRSALSYTVRQTGQLYNTKQGRQVSTTIHSKADRSAV